MYQPISNQSRLNVSTNQQPIALECIDQPATNRAWMYRPISNQPCLKVSTTQQPAALKCIDQSAINRARSYRPISYLRRLYDLSTTIPVNGQYGVIWSKFDTNENGQPCWTIGLHLGNHWHAKWKVRNFKSNVHPSVSVNFVQNLNYVFYLGKFNVVLISISHFFQNTKKNSYEKLYFTFK